MTREEALQWLTNEKWKNANNKYKKEWNEAFEMAIEALSATNLKEEFESAVSVVRCKDCRYYSPIDENKPYPCEVGIMVCNKDDYCSYGERRTSK